MFPRLLAVALCLAASPAFATVLVQEGDSYEELLVLDDALLMTGGQVDHLILWGGPDYQVEGGTIGGIELETGDLFVRGGVIGGIGRSERRSGGTFTEITFEGRYFRLHDSGKREHNSYIVEGWLADGSFMSIALSNAGEIRTDDLPIHFIIVPSDTPIGDTDGDWDIDLDDLNTIRNNFGGAGPGDFNQNGIVDLDDFNLVRNQFGEGEFELDSNNPSSWPYVEITESVTVSWPPLPGSTLVPEPNALLLATALVIALAMHRGFRAP